MKIIIRNSFLLMVLAMALASCAKDDELLFKESDLIYVVSLPDSTDYTFATSPSSVFTDTIEINYRIIGNASDVDREFRLVPTKETTATAGYHYKVGPTVVKANEFSATVPVYVYRKPGLADSTLTVVLQIASNENFNPGFPTQLTYKFTISDILTKPSNWDRSWQAYFGSYSEVKFKFLISATGKTDWNSSPLPQDSRYLSQKARNALLEYNQQYGPLFDEFGDEVFFP